MKPFALAALAALLAAPAAAQMKDMDMKGMHEKKGDHATAHKAGGTVKSVDAAKGSVSIAHGAVQSLHWPAMTMTFRLKDKAMAGDLKPGDKVDFSFVQSGKDYLITEIRK